MITKVYEKVKQFIKENKIFVLVMFFITVSSYIPLPYYIYAPGGLVDVSDRFSIDDGHPSKGSFHMAYVSEYSATLPIYLLALVKDDWDITKKGEVVASNETEEESMIRNKYLLEEANQDAVVNAFRYANKTYEITEEKLYITYIDEKADTQLKINDQILKVDGRKVNSKKSLQNYLKTKEAGSIATFEVLRNEKKEIVTGKMLQMNGNTKIGIMITSLRTLKTNPKITFEFKESESGPSGGLMMSLAIYNQLIEEDITKGRKIAGTGTIDAQGNVGQIGGIEYKIMGAEKESADIFFAPSGKNYQDAKKIAKERDYHVKVVEVKTFDDALKALK